MDSFKSEFRENNYIYLKRQAEELLIYAEKYKNSNALIYACLDTRIALETLDLKKILLSADSSEIPTIIEDSKPKNGIEKNGKKQGSLKEKYQLFYQAVCETLQVNDKYYDFKYSKDLQHKLSTYIHSYYMTQAEINYDSEIMQNAVLLINEVHNFIKSSLYFDGKEWIAHGIKIATIPEDDKKLLEEWKNNSKMKYEDIKLKLKENLILREK
jgi:hypothetical protein